MKTYLSLLLVCLVNTTLATNYYFSTKYGDDTRTSSQASNSSTPWKTLDKLNAFFTNLQPGDSVLLNRGETFYGSIIINRSGTSSLPIVLAAYGSGNRPVITSFVTLSGWTANSTYTGVYDFAANSKLGSQLNMVLLNEVEKGMGRYPNANAPNKGYLTFESHVSNTSITDNELPSSPNWTGAEVAVRPNRWAIDRSKITSQSGTTIYYSPSTTQIPKDGFGYFIQNHIKTLDQFGEWYYNPSTKKLSMYFGTNSPSSYTVKATSIDNLIFSSSRSNLVLDNLTFKGANRECIQIYGGSNIVVQNCDIIFSGTDGVNTSCSNFRLENCTVVNANNDGVDAANSNSPIIRNNIIRNTCYIIGMGLSGNGYGIGIKNGGKGLVEYNQIINTGNDAISLGGDYAVVKNNYIDSFCSVKDDGGGIYTCNHSGTINTGRQIIGNIILNGIGAPEGTTSLNNLSATSDQGIYLDDNSNGVTITGNTVAACNRGIFLHNATSVVTKNNTFYNNEYAQIYMKHDNLGDALRYHTIMNNIFFSKLSTQIVASFNTIYDDLGQMGKLDSNYYTRPIDDNTVISSGTYLYSSQQSIVNLDLQEWKSSSNLDPSSKKSAKEILPYTVNSIIGSNKITNGTFSSSDVSNIWENSCSATWQNSGVLDGGYVKIAPSSATSSIVLKIGALSSSKKYLLNYSLKGTSSMSISAYLRSSDYVALTPKQLRTVSTSRSENEMLFTPSKDESDGALIFSVDAQSAYYLDNIKLYEVDASTTDPNNVIKFVYNTTKNNKTVSLDGSYMDVKGTTYSNSITLKPYASAILIKTDGTISSAPTVSITTPGTDTTYIGVSTISLKASASDADGISKVEFFNGSTLLHTETTAPYGYSWQNVPIGNYTITAKATDIIGMATTSSPVSISVVDNTFPTVSITTPGKDTTYVDGSTINLQATATDAKGINKVEFFNGSTLLATEKYAPYTYSWQNVPIGNYTVTARATNTSGNVTTSPAISISVVDSTSPTVSITTPGADTTYIGVSTIRLRASASDADGISKVEFFNGSTLLHTETVAPYGYWWQNVPIGYYTITAKATDKTGMSTTSLPVFISVVDSTFPIVSITTPETDTTYVGVSTINLEAKAADAKGISKVEFFNGSTLLHKEIIAPYTYSWQNVPLGNYRITARATNTAGNVTTSQGVSISVVASLSRPSVNESDTSLHKDSIQYGGNTATSSTINLNNSDLTTLVDFKLYPNPATNRINLSFDKLQNYQNANLAIQSASGVTLKKMPIKISDKSLEVDISSLPDGVYFITVSTENSSINKKLIKIK